MGRLDPISLYVACSLSYRDLEAGIRPYNIDENKRVKIRQCKCLNNIVEQDHRFIKRQIRPLLGFKSFRSARARWQGLNCGEC